MFTHKLESARGVNWLVT